MKDDGYRLSFSFREDGFSITDNLSGNMFISKAGKVIHNSLDTEIVQQHLKNIQEALISYSVERLPFWKKLSGPAVESKEVLIFEESHYEWSVCCDGLKAKLKDNVLICDHNFQSMPVLRVINYAYSILLTATKSLNPKRDVVRRIVDVGLLVWVTGENSLVVYESNVQGTKMQNCLINGIYYPEVSVDIDYTEQVSILRDSSNEELLRFPLDQSVLSYYTDNA